MTTAVRLGVGNVLEVVNNIFNLEGEERGDEYDLLCPNPGHLDNNPSCSVNMESGYWHCYSCGVGGDLLDLGVLIHRLPTDTPKQRRASREEVEQMLKPHTAESLRSALVRKLAAVQVKPKKAQRRVAMPGPYDPGPLTYMRQRGITNETSKRWGIRWCREQEMEGKKGPFTLRNSIAIPICDQNGKVRNWCYRSTPSSPSWQPKYLYFIDGVSEQWFGLQHHATADEVCIVEGALDAVWMDQCGLPSLGLLGSHMGDRKILWLQNYKRIYLLGDRDPAGMLWVQRLGEMLGRRMPIYIMKYPSWVVALYGKGAKIDPQMLSRVDLEIMKEQAVPWLIYQQKRKAA